MTMGNVMSRLAMILQRKKVTPDEINVVESRSSDHERSSDTELSKEMTCDTESKQYLETTSNIQIVEQCGESSGVGKSFEFAEDSSLQTRTESQDLNINYEINNDLTNGLCASQQNSFVMISSNEYKFAQKKKIFCVNENDNKAVSATESFIKGSEDLHDIFDTDISRENILLNTESFSGSCCKADCPEKPDSLSWLNKDGYSTEGTAGSESFGDKDDDIIDKLLVDNTDDFGVDYGKFDEVPDGRKSSLTPLSLETLNNSELDRRECVLSFIQAWSPLNLPTTDTAYSNSLPGASADILPVELTSSKSYDKFPSIYEESRTSPNAPRELYAVDSQEFILFCQREREPVSRPLSDGWNLFRNDRAPWINIESTGSEKMMHGGEGFKGDDQDSNWPRANADCWQDPTKGLTICSLSTINEESDDAEKIAHL